MTSALEKANLKISLGSLLGNTGVLIIIIINKHFIKYLKETRLKEII